MILYPEVQKKAQAEIDSVVGSERLPSISDRSALPYVRSVMAEVLRWHPALPLGESTSSLDPPSQCKRHLRFVLPNVELPWVGRDASAEGNVERVVPVVLGLVR